MRRTPQLLAIVAAVTACMPTFALGVEPARCYAAREVFPGEVRELTGDVDGHGVPDTVRTRARWADAETCRARLIADVGDDVLRVTIVPSTGIMIAPPGIAGLVDLDRHRGLEVAVVVWRGASTGFVQLYGVHTSTLRALAAGAFEYAGSVVNPAGVDCVRHRGAALVSSSVEYHLGDGRYHGERRFYAFRAGALELVPRLTERISVLPAGLGRFPELATPVPFPSCTVELGAS